MPDVPSIEEALRTTYIPLEYVFDPLFSPSDPHDACPLIRCLHSTCPFYGDCFTSILDGSDDVDGEEVPF